MIKPTIHKVFEDSILNTLANICTKDNPHIIASTMVDDIDNIPLQFSFFNTFDGDYGYFRISFNQPNYTDIRFFYYDDHRYNICNIHDVSVFKFRYDVNFKNNHLVTNVKYRNAIMNFSNNTITVDNFDILFNDIIFVCGESILDEEHPLYGDFKLYLIRKLIKENRLKLVF